jgi:DNA-binding phage protein
MFDRFDAADYLSGTEDAAAYLEAALEEGGDDLALIAQVLGAIARCGVLREARWDGMVRRASGNGCFGGPSAATIMTSVKRLGSFVECSPPTIAGNAAVEVDQTSLRVRFRFQMQDEPRSESLAQVRRMRSENLHSGRQLDPKLQLDVLLDGLDIDATEAAPHHPIGTDHPINRLGSPDLALSDSQHVRTASVAVRRRAGQLRLVSRVWRR